MVTLHCYAEYNGIQKHNRESYRLPNILVLQMNCPDSSPRNKAKNALSLAKSISPEMAGAKIGIFSFRQEKLVEKAKKCNFARLKSPIGAIHQ